METTQSGSNSILLNESSLDETLFPLVKKLRSTPYQFDLQQLLFLIETHFKHTIGTSSLDPFLTIQGAKPSFYAMNASVLSGSITKEQASIQTPWLNLGGIQGPLPLAYTDLLLSQTQDKNFSLKEFLDIFVHRLVSVGYRIQKRFKPSLNTTLNYIPSSILNALSGDPILPHLSHAATLLWMTPRSASGLKRLLESYFSIEVDVSLAHAGYHKAVPKDYTTLGNKGMFQQLGRNTILGKRSWDQTKYIHIYCKLTDWQSYCRLLPNGDLLKKLKNIAQTYINSTTQTKIFISFSGIPKPSKLGHGLSLGRTSFLPTTYYKTYNFIPVLNIM